MFKPRRALCMCSNGRSKGNYLKFEVIGILGLQCDTSPRCSRNYPHNITFLASSVTNEVHKSVGFRKSIGTCLRRHTKL